MPGVCCQRTILAKTDMYKKGMRTLAGIGRAGPIASCLMAVTPLIYLCQRLNPRSCRNLTAKGPSHNNHILWNSYEGNHYYGSWGVYELQPIFLTEFNGHGILFRDYTRDYTKLLNSMSAVKGPLIRLILTAGHMIILYLGPLGYLSSRRP